MMNVVRYLLAAACLVALTAGNAQTGDGSLIELEQPGIQKIAQLTANEHSRILFMLADDVIGYANDGHVSWIDSQSKSSRCHWPHPALSHDGLRVAFVSGDCHIVIYDAATALQRELIAADDDPGEIAWSWDDAEIAFWEHGISAVSVRDASKRLLLPFPRDLDGRRAGHGVWMPMQWLHDNKNLIVEVDTQVPPQNAFAEQDVLLVGGGNARLLDRGSGPSVSPLSDRIAYYTS